MLREDEENPRNDVYESRAIPPAKTRKDACILQEPLVTPDVQCLYWHFKHPEMENLQWVNAAAEEASPGKHTKQCIINEIDKAMENVPHQDWILEWLQDSSPVKVLTVYWFISAALPTCNGYVTEFNDALTNIGKCSTCVSPIGSIPQATSSLFYCGPYMQKHKMTLAQCLTTLHEVFEHIQKYPSVASNTGTQEQTTQHFLM